MVGHVDDVVADGHVKIEEVPAEPLGADEQLPLPMEGLAVHADQILVHLTADDAPGEPEHPAVGKSHGASEPVHIRLIGAAENLSEEPERHANILAPDHLAAVQTVVLQLLPADRRFYPYQWDLNYSNPVVFRDMTDNMLNLCNYGVDVIRLDAVPYIWKALGTNCRNLPQVHTLVRIMRMVCEIVCPGTLLLGEVVMEPSKVVPYFGSVDRPECHMLYNDGWGTRWCSGRSEGRW